MARSGGLSQQRADMLAFGDSDRAVARGRLRPFGDAVQPYSVLDGLAQNHDTELRHRTRWLRSDLALPEFRHRERDGFIERVGLDLDGMFRSLGIGVTDSARAHRTQYTPFMFAFCSLLMREGSFRGTEAGKGANPAGPMDFPSRTIPAQPAHSRKFPAL